MIPIHGLEIDFMVNFIASYSIFSGSDASGSNIAYMSSAPHHVSLLTPRVTPVSDLAL